MKWAFGLIPKRDKAGRWKQSVPPFHLLQTVSLDQFVLFLIEVLVCSNSIIQQKILF